MDNRYFIVFFKIIRGSVIVAESHSNFKTKGEFLNNKNVNDNLLNLYMDTVKGVGNRDEYGVVISNLMEINEKDANTWIKEGLDLT